MEDNLAALMPGKASIEGVKDGVTSKATKTTIAFDDQDIAAIEHLQDLLRERGIRVNEITQTVRLALRLALEDWTDDQIKSIAARLESRWKRGQGMRP